MTIPISTLKMSGRTNPVSRSTTVKMYTDWAGVGIALASNCLKQFPMQAVEAGSMVLSVNDGGDCIGAGA